MKLSTVSLAEHKSGPLCLTNVLYRIAAGFKAHPGSYRRVPLPLEQVLGHVDVAEGAGLQLEVFRSPVDAARATHRHAVGVGDVVDGSCREEMKLSCFHHQWTNLDLN